MPITCQQIHGHATSLQKFIVGLLSDRAIPVPRTAHPLNVLKKRMRGGGPMCIFTRPHPPLTRHGRRPFAPGPVLDPVTAMVIPGRWPPSLPGPCSIESFGGAVAAATCFPAGLFNIHTPLAAISSSPNAVFNPRFPLLLTRVAAAIVRFGSRDGLSSGGKSSGCVTSGFKRKAC